MVQKTIKLLTFFVGFILLSSFVSAGFSDWTGWQVLFPKVNLANRAPASAQPAAHPATDLAKNAQNRQNNGMVGYGVPHNERQVDYSAPGFNNQIADITTYEQKLGQGSLEERVARLEKIVKILEKQLLACGCKKGTSDNGQIIGRPSNKIPVNPSSNFCKDGKTYDARIYKSCKSTCQGEYTCKDSKDEFNICLKDCKSKQPNTYTTAPDYSKCKDKCIDKLTQCDEYKGCFSKCSRTMPPTTNIAGVCKSRCLKGYNCEEECLAKAKIKDNCEGEPSAIGTPWSDDGSNTNRGAIKPAARLNPEKKIPKKSSFVSRLFKF